MSNNFRDFFFREWKTEFTGTTLAIISWTSLRPLQAGALGSCSDGPLLSAALNVFPLLNHAC